MDDSQPDVHVPKKRRFFARSSPSPPQLNRSSSTSPESAFDKATAESTFTPDVKLEPPTADISVEKPDAEPRSDLPDAPKIKEQEGPILVNQDPSIQLDIGMLAAVVGEELSVDVVKRLDDASGGDMQRGRKSTASTWA